MDIDRGFSWKAPVAVLAGVLVLGAVATMLMGTQVSGILSTVGASVGGPPYGEPGNGFVDQGGADDGGGDDAGEADGDGSGADGSGAGGDSAVASLVDATRPDLLIIKHGSILIQAEAVDPALAAATRAIVALGGYTSASQRTGDGEDLAAELTFRIPADRWEDAIIAIRGIGLKVLDERSSTEDVTGQVVDLKARIRNLETTERAFQSIMDKATAIKDILSVQAELTRVRGEIEQLTATTVDLEERAALSTLVVGIALKPAPAVAQQTERFDPGNEAEAATAQLVGILQALATAGIWFGIVWLPVLFALAIVGGIGLVVVRRFRRVQDDGGAPVATAGGSA